MDHLVEVNNICGSIYNFCILAILLRTIVKLFCLCCHAVNARQQAVLAWVVRKLTQLLCQVLGSWMVVPRQHLGVLMAGDFHQLVQCQLLG
jgi:hypothetical protein